MKLKGSKFCKFATRSIIISMVSSKNARPFIKPLLVCRFETVIPRSKAVILDRQPLCAVLGSVDSTALRTHKHHTVHYVSWCRGSIFASSVLLRRPLIHFARTNDIKLINMRLSELTLDQFEPHRDKTNKMACAPSEDSDQPGHLPSLISLRCPLEES